MSEGYVTEEDEQKSDEEGYNMNTDACSHEVLNLLRAVKFGQLIDVERHKEQGTNMEGMDYDQRTALHLAAAEGKEDVVKYLIEDCEVNPLLKDRYGRTAFDDAKLFKHDTIANLLKKKMNERRGEECEIIIEPPCTDNIQSITTCINAAFEGDLDTLRKYAASGTDLSLGDYDRRTPLHLAAAEGHLEVVNYLLKECRVTPTSKDRFDRTAIDEARANRHTEIVQTLIEHTENWIPPEIQNLDPHSIELYVKALKEGKDIPNTIRINIVGHAGVGKTTLTRNLLRLDTDTVEMTNGIDVHVHKARAVGEGKWEKHEEEQDNLLAVKRIVKISLSKSASLDDLVDINEDNSKLSVIGDKFQPSSLDSSRVSSPVHFLVQNPNAESATERRISEDKKMEIMRFNSAMKAHSERDCESLKNITIWDFGGQFIFYATHQLFHSPRAVYLLVLDVSRPLDDIVLDSDFPGNKAGYCNMDIQSFCRFWLKSIHSFVGTQDGDPPVFLVGTHTDLLSGTKNQKQKQAKDYLEKVKRLFVNSPTQKHIQKEVFVVDNTTLSEDEYERLRSCVANLVQDKQTWNPEMPAKWIPLENSLNDKKSMKYITFEEVCRIDKENVIPIGNEEEIRVFLTYHHAQGTYVYFKDDGLSEFVILDPQWIIDAFKCIITSSSFCKMKSTQLLRQELVRDAVLRPKLIDEALSNANNRDFIERKEILLRYLNKLGIIARARHFDISTHVTEELDFFIVPSLLQKSSQDCRCIFRYENMNNPLAFVFIDDIVSPTIYHHITSALLGKWPVVKRKGRPQLFSDSGVYQLDEEHIGIIRITENTIELNVGNTAGNPVDNRLSDHIRRFVEMVLKDSLEKFNVKSDDKYKLCVKCDQSLHVKSKRQSFTPNSHLIDIKLIMQQWFPNTLKTISSLRRSKKVTQRELSKLPNAIGCNWELLGISLGVQKIQIDRIKMESPYSTAVQMYHMFNIWFEFAGDNATWDVLLKEMGDHYRVSIDWDIVRNILDDVPTEHADECLN